MPVTNEETLQKYLRKAAAELRQVRNRLSAEEAKNREPIAIIGIGCRFPGGVRSPEDLWEVVDSGQDVLSGLPVNRGWNLAGRMPELRGGFLHDADRFDPEFFGMTPAEARAMDPQQRLLLETSWEAFERAGIDPVSARETRTAVYAGLQFGGYPLLVGGPPPEELQQFIGFGSSSGAATGRVSYLMDLLGGAVSVDTQCTSSIVATHLAVKALRNGECTLALAGGACVMSLPVTFLDFLRRKNLASDCRSKSFSAAADGASLSEGAGMLLLERLSDARRNGHRVLAVIRGSAINQDGSTNGMWAPRGQAQERVIRQALADARLTPENVDVVEGHGVGAALGDGVEARAVISTYGREHSADEPVRLGSVKSTIGHTQTVGALAGIIKMVMAMQHERIPKTLHVDRPTPHADWSAGTVRLATESEPWPKGERIRRAGVTCLTLSGTNAHLVLEEAPAEEPAERPAATVRPDGPVPWIISAKSPEALRHQAARVRETCAEADVHDVGAALHTTRPSFPHRAVVVGRDRQELLAGLDALSRDGAAANLVRGTAESRGRTALVFSGDGREQPGAGRELYAAFPAFARALDEVCAELDAVLATSGKAEGSRPLRELMLDPAGRYGSPRVARAARFAFGVALHRLVDAFGVTAEYVTGLGVGEVAAAHAAGVLGLADACALALAPNGPGEVPADGASVWIQATEDELLAGPGLGGPEARAGIAAVNEPGGTVVSGDRERVREIADHWRARGRATGPLAPARPTSVGCRPGTSAGALERVVDRIAFTEAAIPFVSGLDGTVVPAERLRTPEYWADHSRRPTRFLAAATRLRDNGVTRFLELGPDAALTALAQRCVAAHGGAGQPVLLVGAQGGADEAGALLTAVGALHADGVAVDWAPAFEGHRPAHVDLPTSPFQYQRYWLVPPDGSSPDPAGPAAAHPLLGTPLELADPAGQWFTQSLTGPDGPLPVRVHGTPVLSPGVLADWALAAAGIQTPGTLWGVELHKVAAFPTAGPLPLQTLRGGDGSLVRGFARTGSAWEPLVSVAAAEPAGRAPDGPADPASLASGLTERPVAAWYARLWRQGVEHDRGAAEVTGLWGGTDEVVAQVRRGAGGTPSWAPVLDAAFALASTIGDRCLTPRAVERLTVHGELPDAVWVHARRHADGSVGVRLVSEAGQAVATVEGLALRPISEDESASLAAAPLRRHELVWQPLADGSRVPTIPVPEGSWLVYAADAERAREWRTQLLLDGIPALAVVPGSGTADEDPDTLFFAPDRADGPEQVWAELRRRGKTVAGLLFHGGDASADAEGLLDGAWTAGRDGFTFLRNFLRAYADRAPKVVLCTTGATGPQSPDAGQALPQTLFTALARTIIWEHPHLPCVQADLEPGDGQVTAGGLVRRAAGLNGSGHLALRDGRWYTARLRESALPGDGEGAVKIREGVSYLVLGGSGTAASAVVDWLAGQGATSVVLAGAGAAEVASRDGVQLTVWEGELDDAAAVSSLLEHVERGLPPLRGVVHLTSPMPSAPLDAWEWDEFRAALGRAVRGPWHLHQQTLELDFFVLSSPVGALPGRGGETVAVAADAFFEALAGHRRHEGLPAVSVAWGPWQGTEQAGTASLQEAGIHPAPADAALHALGQVLAGAAPRVGLARADWRRYLAAAGRTVPYAPVEAADAGDGEATMGFGQRVAHEELG
ncbi:type I polyketide synthase [Streptomyces sp. I05A-00742]|uniref:type I polyketide synthase n=1 Tax=Streptomyces sp. I05A-00742 TaxID=2732853 RepID=UPI0014877AED|nr:type I polyketide synthase [Streptomyces sp. I05A-00742]